MSSKRRDATPSTGKEVDDKRSQDAGSVQVPTAVVPFEKREDFGSLCSTASFLSFISGMVNVFAVMELGTVVAHQSGNISAVGRMAGDLQNTAAARFLGIVLAYTFGSAVIGVSGCEGDAVFEGRPSNGLLGSAVAVATGAVLRYSGLNTIMTLLIWSFSQGLQNGVTSQFSSGPLRTTHMTGVFTDSGLILGKWVRAWKKGADTPNLRKPIIFLLCAARAIQG